MAGSGKSKRKRGADGGATGGGETLHPPRHPPGSDPLITALGGGTLDFAALLAISDLLPVMTGYLDRDYRYAFVNRPLADWLGQPRDAILGHTLAEVLGQANFEQRRPMLETALAGERTFFASEFEFGARGPVAVQTDYVPWADPSGNVQGIIVLVQDVTESRAAERAIRESEQRFRRIADSAPVPIWVTRLDRKRDFVNHAYVELMGVGPEEALKMNWVERIHPDDRERMIADTITGENSRHSFSVEARFERGPSEWRWMRAVSQPRFGPDGAIIGYIGVATDITLSKQSEIELRRLVEERTAELAKSEARFRAIFEAALEVMVLLEPDGTVIAVNNRRELWRHPDPTQSLGTKLWDAPTLQAYPQHIGLMRDGVAQAAGGKTFTTEAKMEREGVPTAYLDVSVQPVRGDDGDIVYLLFEARDITELKFAQEQLRQSQKMEALGQLTGGIAHDFNNLLTVVVGALDLIVKRSEDAKLKRYAENALSAAERGARLTGQLLAFSRVQRLEVRPTQVAPLIETMRPLLLNVLGPGIEHRFDLGANMVPVMADPTQLEVAVLNLAINARDAMPDGGVLSIATRIVEIAAGADPELEPGKYVELTIADTGEGMTEDVLARAFEPFFTTKDVGKGTGLGLSMVYGMARQSGGTARIESVAGKGSAIKLYFRAADHARPADHDATASEPAAVEAQAGAAGVLVIDDDPDVRGFIAAALAEQGYAVREAADGKAGLDAVAKARPDVVVLDFIMPGITGAEVARRILAQYPGQPILFVSGYSETEAVKQAAPGAPLLAKPFRADALGKAVRRALAKR